MTLKEQMRLVELAVKDLSDAVTQYSLACERSKYGKAAYGVDEIPRYYTKESIIRRIVQIRQDLLILEGRL